MKNIKKHTYKILSVTELFCCFCALAIGQVELHVVVEAVLDFSLFLFVFDFREEVPHQDVLTQGSRHPLALITKLDRVFNLGITVTAGLLLTIVDLFLTVCHFLIKNKT